MSTTELVQFRMFIMPCCGHNLCWVNPRLPSCCPECGSQVFVKLKSGDFTIMDCPATLRVDSSDARILNWQYCACTHNRSVLDGES